MHYLVPDPHSIQDGGKRVAAHVQKPLLDRPHEIRVIEFEMELIYDLRVDAPPFDIPGPLAISSRQVKHLTTTPQCNHLSGPRVAHHRPVGGLSDLLIASNVTQTT